MQELKIRWIRLLEIAKDVAGKEVAITLTTDFPDSDDRVAIGLYNVYKLDIILNAREVKSEFQVVEAVAHELAHCITRIDGHTTEFFDCVAKVELNILTKIGSTRQNDGKK